MNNTNNCYKNKSNLFMQNQERCINNNFRKNFSKNNIL